MSMSISSLAFCFLSCLQYTMLLAKVSKGMYAIGTNATSSRLPRESSVERVQTHFALSRFVLVLPV
jgi:hypothetical protein